MPRKGRANAAAPPAAWCRCRCSPRAGTPAPSPHILGVRAFGTQLLCEQVVGRALRRQSYDLNEEALFNVEYADVLGIPVRLHRPAGARQAAEAAGDGCGKGDHPGRDACEIRFPRVQGYRVELPEGTRRRQVRPLHPGPHPGHRRPIRDAQCRHHRRGRRPEPDPPPRPAPRHAGLPPHQDPAGCTPCRVPGISLLGTFGRWNDVAATKPAFSVTRCSHTWAQAITMTAWRRGSSNNRF